jgi:hypothetical protein
MNEVDGRRLIRPWFLGASTVIFILLVPVLAHSVWDYIEVRHLDAAIAAIERSGEPTTAALRMDLAGAPADADRYYRAAAALSSGRATKQLPNDIIVSLRTAEHDDVWPRDLVESLRSWVDSQSEAIQFADRAAALPFVGFGPGSAYSYLTADLVTLFRGLGSRAIVRAISGDADGAGESLYSEIRMNRPLDSFFGAARMAGDLRTVFSHARPSIGSLARLSAALAEADRDDVAKRQLVRMRAYLIDGERNLRDHIVMRPWRTHVMNRALAGYAQMIRASERPWPERIEAIAAAEYWPSLAATGHVGSFMRSVVEGQAERLALVRAARIAVAVEQYEREHEERLPASLDALVPAYLAAAPIDPFSGRSMLLLTSPDGYTVYSVGRNRGDDGGRDIGQSFAGRTAWPRQSLGTDVGIRIARKN